jgi:hypothetical protein
MFKQYSADIVKQREQHTQAMTKAADQYDHSTLMLKREITQLKERIENSEHKKSSNPLRDWFGSPKHTDSFNVGANTKVFDIGNDEKRVEPKSESSFESCNDGLKTRLSKVLNRYSGHDDKPVTSHATSSTDKTITHTDPPSLAGSGFTGTPYNPSQQGPVGGHSLSGWPGISGNQHHVHDISQHVRGNTGYPDQHGNTHQMRQPIDNKTIGQQLLSGMTGVTGGQSNLPFVHNGSTNYSSKHIPLHLMVHTCQGLVHSVICLSHPELRGRASHTQMQVKIHFIHPVTRLVLDLSLKCPVLRLYSRPFGPLFRISFIHHM